MEERDFVGQIEEMTPEDLNRRVQAAMDYDIRGKIRTIPFLAGEKEIVEYQTAELTAKCPMTGLRDFYRLTIRFEPQSLLPELKSLKLYFAGYDDLPISHEHLAAKIYRDFQDIVQPAKLSLKLDTAVRGGITTTVTLGDVP